jgi:MerR family transcriptional regulator, thiopeptide resistance regulator
MQSGRSPESDEVQAIAKPHVQWLSQAIAPSKGYLLGLGNMYVSDPRFAANYEKHAVGTAAFVRDAMTTYAERNFT